jgi:cytochrome c oxidase accessory protein FixG
MDQQKIPLAEEVVDSSVLNLYEKREKIYTRKVEGRFQNIRLYTGWPLLLGYFICPWLVVNEHQAILFDLPARKFHIFWLTFWPQDLVLLGWALIIAAFALFAITTLLGRVWCGYTCPQTVWTAMFMWAEQVAEGDRHQRMNLDKQPWSVTKARKRMVKHGLWFGIAGLTGITFISYFYGVRPLLIDLYNLQLPLVTVFWVCFFSLATYINAGWMREQVCIYMCPYARFQSAMFDKDTLIVSYDDQRGEHRGSRKRSVAPEKVGLGDCIDCQMCVQVCPTGIDIRDGLQYECINCALCVDACDEIMDRMGYDPGLISYTTINKQAGGEWTWKRPRLLGYFIMLIIMMIMFSGYLLNRIPVELDVVRSRGQLFQESVEGLIRNSYRLKIINMDLEPHGYEVSVNGVDSYELLVNQEDIRVAAGSIGEVAVDVLIDPGLLASVNTTIEFQVSTRDGQWVTSSSSTFIGPVPIEFMR